MDFPENILLPGVTMLRCIVESSGTLERYRGAPLLKRSTRGANSSWSKDKELWNTIDVGVPFFSTTEISMQTWAPEDCPLCPQGVPLKVT